LEEIARDRKRVQAERSTKSLKKIKLQSPERKKEDTRKATEKFREPIKASCPKNTPKNTPKNKDPKRFYEPSVSVHSAIDTSLRHTLKPRFILRELQSCS
jgi:hypothetical protein